METVSAGDIAGSMYRGRRVIDMTPNELFAVIAELTNRLTRNNSSPRSATSAA
jgi:hypothetical protein